MTDIILVFKRLHSTLSNNWKIPFGLLTLSLLSVLLLPFYLWKQVGPLKEPELFFTFSVFAVHSYLIYRTLFKMARTQQQLTQQYQQFTEKMKVTNRLAH